MLGAPLPHPDEALTVLEDRRRADRERVLEPVTTVWQGNAAVIPVNLPTNASTRPLTARLSLESGDVRQLPVQVSAASDRRATATFVRLPKSLPWGYHRFSIDVQGRLWGSTVLCSPRQAYAGGINGKALGVFLPLYAMHSRRSWGAGDLADLGALHEWVASLGGAVVGILPLLASYLDEPFGAEAPRAARACRLLLPQGGSALLR